MSDRSVEKFALDVATVLWAASASWIFWEDRPQAGGYSTLQTILQTHEQSETHIVSRR
jgi:hypothetical protein